ncbi:MAG: Transglycosylase-associated protein [Chloroflexi bacterium]|nr:Transglycosylase-associated protein [Chloroflexota bacterium]
MGILSWIVVGLIAGWLAGKVMKGGGYGLIGDIVVGVLGGVLGGFIASYFFNMGDPMSGINLPSILIAFGGAVLLLVVVRMLTGRRVFSH